MHTRWIQITFIWTSQESERQRHNKKVFYACKLLHRNVHIPNRDINTCLFKCRSRRHTCGNTLFCQTPISFGVSKEREHGSSCTSHIRSPCLYAQHYLWNCLFSQSLPKQIRDLISIKHSKYLAYYANHTVCWTISYTAKNRQND